MRVSAPAKINLHLRVGPRQSDGFHPVMTWMVTVGLFDMLDFSLDTAGHAELICDDPTLPVDESNLIVKAIRLMQAKSIRYHRGDLIGLTGGKPVETAIPGVRVKLRKLIPAGGGLGGGSSDATATLRTLNDLWKLNLPEQRLSELAATLGSDIPFFLKGPSGICTGRGEIIEAIPPPSPKWVLLMLPGMSMPTPAVYRQFDAMAHPGTDNWDQPVDWMQWQRLSAINLLQQLRNDLERPAFAINPSLGQLRSDAETLIARPVRMSGSGSTLFTLFDARDEANVAAARIRDDEGLRNFGLKTIVAHVAPDEVNG